MTCDTHTPSTAPSVNSSTCVASATTPRIFGETCSARATRSAERSTAYATSPRRPRSSSAQRIEPSPAPSSATTPPGLSWRSREGAVAGCRCRSADARACTRRISFAPCPSPRPNRSSSRLHPRFLLCRSSGQPHQSRRPFAPMRTLPPSRSPPTAWPRTVPRRSRALSPGSRVPTDRRRWRAARAAVADGVSIPPTSYPTAGIPTELASTTTIPPPTPRAPKA